MMKFPKVRLAINLVISFKQYCHLNIIQNKHFQINKPDYDFKLSLNFQIIHLAQILIGLLSIQVNYSNFYKSPPDNLFILFIIIHLIILYTLYLNFDEYFIPQIHLSNINLFLQILKIMKFNLNFIQVLFDHLLH